MHQSNTIIYTKDNIANLLVRRGGSAEYRIIWAGNWEAEIKHTNGRSNFMPIERVLAHLNSGKWTIVDKTIQPLYEIF